MESYIVKAFVKGIFKTSGALLVLGVGMFIYENYKITKNFKITEIKKSKFQEGIDYEIDTEKQETETKQRDVSIGVNSVGDVAVIKTDKDDSGQLYVRGTIFKACGELNKEKETPETEIVNKDFKQLFTF